MCGSEGERVMCGDESGGVRLARGVGGDDSACSTGVPDSITGLSAVCTVMDACLMARRALVRARNLRHMVDLVSSMRTLKLAKGGCRACGCES